MRLINTKNVPELSEFIGDSSSIPQYAILSHTWEDEEITLQQLSDPACAQKKGLRKIQQTCTLAAQNGFDFAWVDTCCIDKRASAELSEAINSMFRWYQDAAVCYVFLADLDPSASLEGSLPHCRWFTRGWTLQELIAPREVLFYDRDWNYRGNKNDLADLIATITRIPVDVLRQEIPLYEFSVACKMSWASQRLTTRIEDMAYCMLGIFDVNMSLIYGEQRKAFARLQETIVQTTGDLSIFAWTFDPASAPCPEYTGFFADSPRHFKHCSDMKTTREDSIYRDLKVTVRGIQLEASLVHLYLPSHPYQPVLSLICTVGDDSIGIYIRKIGGNRYARWKPDLLALFKPRAMPRLVTVPTKYVAEVTSATSSLCYRAGGLPVETMLLPTALPPTFPFHKSDPVLGNRISALRVSWEVRDGLHWEAIRHVAYPGSHWDRHDGIFFCSTSISHSWGAIVLEFEEGAQADNSEYLGTPQMRRSRGIGIFVACFFWNRNRAGPPVTVAADVGSIGLPAVSALEFKLTAMKFESATTAWILVQRTFGDSLFLVGENGNDSGSAVHMGFGGNLDARFVVRGDVVCPEVCVNPITCLDISVGKRV